MTMQSSQYDTEQEVLDAVMVKVLWETKYDITIKAMCMFYIYMVCIQIYGICEYTCGMMFSLLFVENF